MVQINPEHPIAKKRRVPLFAKAGIVVVALGAGGLYGYSLFFNNNEEIACMASTLNANMSDYGVLPNKDGVEPTPVKSWQFWKRDLDPATELAYATDETTAVANVILAAAKSTGASLCEKGRIRRGWNAVREKIPVGQQSPAETSPRSRFMTDIASKALSGNLPPLPNECTGAIDYKAALVATSPRLNPLKAMSLEPVCTVGRVTLYKSKKAE